MQDKSSTQTYISGDQNSLWDALLKIAVVHAQGGAIDHYVHTGDLFSRPLEGQALQGVRLSQEAYRKDGNVNRWSATVESATFLGRMPVPPGDFVRRRVSLESVSWARAQSESATIESLTQGDWWGVTYGDATCVAHGMPIENVLSEISDLRKRLRNDLIEFCHPEYLGSALEQFDHLWTHSRYRTNQWSSGVVAMMEAHCVRLGINLTRGRLSTSVDLFAEQSGDRNFFDLFVMNYREAQRAYNDAVHFDGEFIEKISYGELPFYAVVAEGQKIIRRELVYDGETSGRDVVRKLQADTGGVVQAIMGKALPLLIQLRMKKPLLFPEKGSAYVPKSIRLAHFYQKYTGQNLGLYPLYRMHPHALDALSLVRASFRLPKYLRPFFGQEWISGIDFAQKWRTVVQHAQEELERITQMPGLKSLPMLVESGLVSPHVVELSALITRNNTEAGLKKREFFDTRKKQGIRPSKEDIAQLDQEVSYQYGIDFYKSALRGIEAQVESVRAQRIGELLAVVQSLSYWDCRPFIHWVLAIPGWLESIKQQATITIDSLQSDVTLLK